MEWAVFLGMITGNALICDNIHDRHIHSLTKERMPVLLVSLYGFR